MRTKGLLKKTVTIFTCLAVMLSAFGFSGMTALAGESAASAESEWAMTVPQIRVTTENGNGTTLQKEDGYQNAQITITGVDGSVLSDNCVFKVRGNTTALSWVEKKAFTFKFSKKKDVLGMGKGKKWALIANAFDPTLLRNLVAFSLAKELDIPYTSEFKVTELWVDGVFRGCYVLFEPVQEGKDRVDIDIESNDGKKDFLIEYEKSREEEGVTYFTVDGLRYISGEPEEPTEDQLAYIESTMQDISQTIRKGSRAEIESKIDVDSFAKYYILNEVMKTYDFDMSSVFFYYKNGRLYAGPPWDYDLSAGNAGSEGYPRPDATLHTDGAFVKDRIIYKFLCKHDWFMEQVRLCYRDHIDYIANLSAEGGLLDTLRSEYGDVFARNYNEAGWKVSKHWINIQRKPLPTYDENYDYLKNWLAERQTWMNDYYDPTAPVYLIGDTDGNGVIDINDVTELQRILAEFDVEDSDSKLLRAAGGERADINSATAMQRYLAADGDSGYIGNRAYTIHN